MTGFWLLAALLLLISCVLFAPLFLGKSKSPEIDRRRLNLILHRQRQEELAQEASGPALERLRDELDRELLEDLSVAEGHGKTEPGKGRGGLIVGLAAAPLLGILLYSMLGRYDLAGFSGVAEPPAEKAVTPEIQQMIDGLAEKLKKEPGNLKGWVLLGRSYQQTEQFGKAVDAYAQALRLDPDNPDIKALFAESLGDYQDGSYAGEPEKIAAEILAKNPKHRSALWLAGAAAAQKGDAAKAIGFLETLRGEFPKGSPDDEHLGKIIDQVKMQARQSTEPAGSDQTGGEAMPATGEEKSIRVKVSLAEALKGKAAPDDIVFIFARAASGPPMPLAIVRRKAKELPVEVVLDDSMSMMQGMNLSAFDRIVIGARISKTGQALPKPGDLQGLTQPTAIENGASYAVTIGEEIK